MDLALAGTYGTRDRAGSSLRPQTLLAVIRAVVLATFAATEVALPSHVLEAAALYVVGACVLGNLRPKWRDADAVLLITIVCADIIWCTAAFVYFGPAHSLPSVLYAGLVTAIVAAASGWTAIALGVCTGLVYAATLLYTHRGGSLGPCGVQLVVVHSVLIALAGTLSGCLADLWRRLARARETAVRLQRLNRVSAEAIVDHGDDHVVLSIAAQAALSIFDARRAWVMLPAEGEDTALVLEAFAGFAAPDRQESITRGGVGVAGKVWETGQGLVCASRGSAPRNLSPLESQLSLGQLIAAPIVQEDSPIGVLLATRDSGTAPFTGDDLAVLALLGQSVSTLLQTAGLIRDLHLSSNTDSLTGLLNHGVFLTMLAQHVQHAREAGEELSLIVLDMDEFKHINDTAGHWEGNRVLRALAEGLREACRDTDIVARCGGDEFAVLLPGVGPEEAAVVAERAAEALHNAAVRPGIRIPVSASWGIASYPWDATTDEALFRRADDRLYEAKKAGGNHVACDPIALGTDSAGSVVKPVELPLRPQTAPTPPP